MIVGRGKLFASVPSKWKPRSLKWDVLDSKVDWKPILDFMKPKYEHIFITHSMAIGGVETAILSYLNSFPTKEQSKTCIMSMYDNLAWKLPEKVFYKKINFDELKDIICPGIKTIWVQPLIGIPDEFVEYAKGLGIKVLYMVVSTVLSLVRRGKELSPTYYVSTSEQLDDFCKNSDLTPLISLHHHVADPIYKKKNTGGYRLGFVGRNSVEKNSHLIPRVLLYLDDKFTINYFVPDKKAPNGASSLEILNKTKEITKTMGFENRVYFNYDITNPDEIYSNIDILLLPSMFEGYSMVAHEALVRGIPVIISDKLALGKENNPGLMEFELNKDRVLDDISVRKMAYAIEQVSELDPFEIASQSSEHTLSSYFASESYKSLLEVLA